MDVFGLTLHHENLDAEAIEAAECLQSRLTNVDTWGKIDCG